MNLFLRILLVVLLSFGIVIIGFGYAYIKVCLSPAEKPVKADVILCLSGGGARVDRVVALLEKKYADSAVVTTQSAYKSIKVKLENEKQVKIYRESARNTFEEAIALKAIAHKQGFQKILVVSDAWHLYRAKWTLEMLHKDEPMVFSFNAVEQDSPNHIWWGSKNHRIIVLTEIPKVVFYWVWYGLLKNTNEPAWASNIESRYVTFLKGIL